MSAGPRQFWVRLHRWAGLATALFLFIAGLTGAVLVFEEELDAWLNPALMRAAPPAGGGPMMDPYALREAVQRQLPWARVDQLPLRREPGHSVSLRLAPRLDAASGRPLPLAATHAYVDPYSGAVLGVRQEGRLSLARQDLIPMLYRIHCELALPGIWGRLLFGVIALVWTLDCFAGFYLTLPTRGARRGGFWRGWKPAWLIKRGAGAARITLDVHRAFSLWLWALLLVYAWSSVMFNLRAQVYQPLMSAILPFDTSWREAPVLPRPIAEPGLDWREAHAAARAEMAVLARERGFTVDGEEMLMLDRRRGLYGYLAHSDADLRSRVGNTGILIDAASGERRGIYLPTRGAAGDTFSNWLGALHMAHVFGLPYRLLALATGLAVAALSVTGVMIWWRKRRGRRRQLPAASRMRVTR
ncbi:iron-regulated membrane protein [Achromobacter sp. RTa]|uniref:PepSY-associated TM helix domain-containing protein n=1 Tax=Achromobacter sp. RTa TaxID=1532557 RepID=UPI00050F23EE|nr:PepSY-associated TM helix domain-containing protein [Achromobacter sp. RTa]KGD89858.1 iron-regulated membrane protein [Achromobacter sp. RTa]